MDKNKVSVKGYNDDAISKLKDLVYYLKTHNKNYTKEQYYKILEMEEILESL